MTATTNDYHLPVLLNEAVEGLVTDPGGNYVDVTYGGGGHSRLILEKIRNGRLLAFDKDPAVQHRLIEDERFYFAAHDFIYLQNFLRFYDMIPADGILADLGVSSRQLDEASRGFAHRLDGKLDMRMDPEQNRSALEVINKYPEADLSRIFREYGELRHGKKLAKLVSDERSGKLIETTAHLADTLSKAIPPGMKKSKFLSMAFQAIRLEVNREPERLKIFLKEAMQMLKPGGRLVVISYHSLEDRLVKYFFNTGNFEGKMEKDQMGNVLRPMEPVTRKAVIPSEKETENNPRARSARLRIAKKKEGHE